MSSYKTKLKQENFEDVNLFLKEALAQLGMQENTPQENLLICEELFVRACMQNIERDADVIISVERRLGDISITFQFDGDRFIVDLDRLSNRDPGSLILNHYKEKIYTNYRRGINFVSVSARRTNYKSFVLYTGAAALAVVLAIVLHLAGDTALRTTISEKILYPIESLFGNAMRIISAPIVLFSMITNLSTVYTFVDRRYETDRTIRRLIFASILAILIGFVPFLVYRLLSLDLRQTLMPVYLSEKLDATMLLTIFNDLVPPTLSGIFTSMTPFPLLLLSFVSAEAVCLSGKYFDTIKSITDAIYTFLCKVLYIIMLFLPLAFFVSVLHELLTNDVVPILYNYGICILAALLGLVLLFSMSALRIRFRGGKPVTFLRAVLPAMAVNLKINSTIDAVPYNIRFCAKTFGIPTERLRVNLPILAQISQTGNCFFLTLITLSLALLIDVPLTPAASFVLALMIFSLAVGAPGQPGSIMIGMLLMLSFLNLDLSEFLPIIIIAEVLFGSISTFINTMDDIEEVYLDSLPKKLLPKRLHRGKESA